MCGMSSLTKCHLIILIYKNFFFCKISTINRYYNTYIMFSQTSIKHLKSAGRKQTYLLLSWLCWQHKITHLSFLRIQFTLTYIKVLFSKQNVDSVLSWLSCKHLPYFVLRSKHIFCIYSHYNTVIVCILLKVQF